MLSLTDKIAGYQTPPVALRPEQSEAIAIARVLCILGIIYAHAWTGRGDGYVILHSDSWQGMLRWFFVETIGRSSVPLLGMVSGWLVVGSASRRSYGEFVKYKARTILAPMIAWNAIALLLLAVALRTGWVNFPQIRNLEWIFQELTSFSRSNYVNYQTPFLRDLFVCMLFAPLLIRLTTGPLAGLTVIVLIWTIANWYFPLIIRPQVALFFLLGMIGRRLGFADRIVAMPGLLVFGGFAFLAATKFVVSVWGYGWSVRYPALSLALEMAMRVSAAMFMWRLCSGLVGKPVAARIKRFEPYAFLLFCSHMIVIWLVAQKIGQWTGPLDSPAWPWLFVGQPLIVVPATLIIGQLLMKMPRGVTSLLSGGRLKPVTREQRAVTA